jgi:hypothetical protein
MLVFLKNSQFLTGIAVTLHEWPFISIVAVLTLPARLARFRSLSIVYCSVSVSKSILALMIAASATFCNKICNKNL